MKAYQLENYRKIKEQVRQDTWCTAHAKCFRASFAEEDTKDPESEEHMNMKFERWKYWRKEGYFVLAEAILTNGMRPDSIVFNENELFIEEIVYSEKKSSILKKKEEYPFPMFVFDIGEEGG